MFQGISLSNWDGSTQTVPHNTATILEWSTVNLGETAYFDEGDPTNIIIPDGRAGIYICGAIALVNSSITAPNPTSPVLQIWKNDTTLLLEGIGFMSNNDQHNAVCPFVAGLVEVADGDTLAVHILQYSGEDLLASIVDHALPNFWLARFA